MTGEQLLWLSIIGSVSASVGVWWWLRAPLRTMLDQLCDRPGSTDFWSRYTLLMLVIAPLALAVLFSPDGPRTLAAGLRYVLLAILAGQFVAFALMGRGLFKAVRQAMTPPANEARE
jgi:Na+-driven multidrug efflux pump